MKILITGAYGFIGKNLICELKNKGYHDLCFCGKDTSIEELDKYTKDCDFVFHLAGVNRPEHVEEFMSQNYGFTDTLLQMLKKHKNTAPILCTSSTQAMQDNPYGKSKLAEEEAIFNYGKETGAPLFVYRLTNVFGKWCRPNYNSVVATFCYNVANDLPIQINDENKVLDLVYIDDVLKAFISCLEGHGEDYINATPDGRLVLTTLHKVSLGRLAGLIKEFKKDRVTLNVPDMANGFTKKLYSTFLSYMPEEQFAYPLKMNIDNRGSFTEILKTQGFGQVSVNISKPGITKGNHWHHTKTEKFLVVSGKGVIRFKKVFTDLFDDNNIKYLKPESIIEYFVSGEKLEVIDIPPGYTHNITNLGDTDMVTIMWANESYNPNDPDTYFLEV
ncbi:polysaccharide biosynthesis C-terminal domain-containing protein [Aminipila terrae]|uniref:NAD-dependent epimerase/dehydratase family protein n=1 Tax=Aminipila terrae TaxID=2697030 RepID=A0A6P1MM61_9FIRM|nr:NAD-dependent epimerase/dehydratase family protein [Aminipila terrae]QHI72085.1 NAD-dependent epimerase/dehydratase family protein [Aminipila terrae]